MGLTGFWTLLDLNKYAIIRWTCIYNAALVTRLHTAVCTACIGGYAPSPEHVVGMTQLLDTWLESTLHAFYIISASYKLVFIQTHRHTQYTYTVLTSTRTTVCEYAHTGSRRLLTNTLHVHTGMSILYILVLSMYKYILVLGVYILDYSQYIYLSIQIYTYCIYRRLRSVTLMHTPIQYIYTNIYIHNTYQEQIYILVYIQCIYCMHTVNVHFHHTAYQQTIRSISCRFSQWSTAHHSALAGFCCLCECIDKPPERPRARIYCFYILHILPVPIPTQYIYWYIYTICIYQYIYVY